MTDERQAAPSTVNEPRHLAVNERLVYDDGEGVSLWASEVMERSGAIGIALQERVGGGRSNRLYIPAEFREQAASALSAARPPAPSDSLEPRAMRFRCPECSTEFSWHRVPMMDDDVHCPGCGYGDEARYFDDPKPTTTVTDKDVIEAIREFGIARFDVGFLFASEESKKPSDELIEAHRVSGKARKRLITLAAGERRARAGEGVGDERT